MKVNFTLESSRDLIAIGKTLMPLIFLCAVAFFFREFVVHAVEANLAINLGIILAAAYGVLLIMIRLSDAQKDFRVIERFGQEVHAGVDMKKVLEEPWLQARYVRHYLNHVANTGGQLSSQMDQTAIENELHALQKEYDNRLELPQFLVGFMIAMGLLGTFIGLLETLTGISGMLDGMGAAGAGNLDQQFMKLVVELRKPLAGMGIAFSASMFGLIGSLTLAIMMINLRRYIGKVISLARNVMHDLVDITSHSVPPGHVVREEHPAALINTGSGISATMLVGRFDLLAKKIEMIVDAIQTSTASTQKLVDLLGFGPRMRELSEKNLEELRLISASGEDMQKAMQRLADSGEKNVKANNEALRDMVENLRKLDETNLGGARHLWEIKEKLNKLSENFSMVELMATGISSQTVLLETLIQVVRKDQAQGEGAESSTDEGKKS